MEGFVAALREGAALDATGLAPPAREPVAIGAPKVLIFAPHPDDEVIIGGLPLRLSREQRCDVVNVAVTLGSRPERRTGRWRELRAACDYIGFRLLAPAPNGLEGINLRARAQQPGQWRASVEAVAAIIGAERPSIVFLPHADDRNRTHVGTHQLVVEAMREHAGLTCLVVETEFWAAMGAPNLMVESTPADVADLVAALSLHAGEIARNPYHLRLPAWMMDNVRRGAELVGGQGATAPRFTFATLYRLRGWADRGWREALERGRIVSAKDGLSELFPPPAR